VSAPFWETLERCLHWQRANLPATDTRQGLQLLIWLLKNEGQALPVGDLYRSTNASEPTMREAVKLFIDHGLAAIETGCEDSRLRLIGSTGKLKTTVAEYRRQLIALAGPGSFSDGPGSDILPSLAVALGDSFSNTPRLATELVNNGAYSLSYDAALSMLVVVWKRPTSSQFRLVHEMLLEMMRFTDARKILADDTHLPTIRRDDQKWVVEQWIPRAHATGLRVAASKKPNSPQALRAVRAIHSATEALTFRTFGDLARARQWLKVAAI